MINIQVKNGDLVIEDKTEDIFDWRHRVFFNISLGFKVDEENTRYYYSDNNEFLDIIKEVIDYLDEEKIEFEADKTVLELISHIKNQDLEFEEVTRPLEISVPISQPISLQRELKPYQLKGLEHFLQIKHGANFSVPGSGKTTMVYAYFDKIKQEGIVDKIFVVGPFSSFAPWEDESEKCFGQKLRSARLVGNKRQSYYLLSKNYDIFLCHYQTAANDISSIIDLCNRHKFLMVIDESHYIKRFEGGVWSNALLTIAPHAVRRVILSGTPMPNGYIDLWSQMTFLWYGKQLLKDRIIYKNRCADPTQQEEIKKEIRPFFYRVTKTDLKLPEPNTIKREYELKPIQQQIYYALTTRLLTQLNLQLQDRNKLKQWRKAKMVRLLQTASNPTLLNRYSEEFNMPPLESDGTSLIELIEKYAQFEVPAKFEIALDLIKNLLSEGKKVLLWTSFVHNIKMLEELFRDIKYFSIYGAIPKDDEANEEFNREKQIRDFKTIDEPALLIANPAACAESISLHKVCHDAIYLDRTFNCGQFIQSKDRIHRIGLEKDEVVNYHILIAKNTIDETIDRRLDEKFETMKRVLEDEIPIGSLDVEAGEMEQTENEEQIDFEETIKDIESFLKK
ncbi:MAG: DEAD/DEAH box helicase [Pyrinomonadaceae bacterium]